MATKTAKTSKTAKQLTKVFVPGVVQIGQVVNVEGTDYKVTEINLARPNFPVLTRVAE
jgi:hypothetical protein